jgi:hypothetical protein
MEKIHGIHEIFQRDNDGSYSQNARLYQDILKYFLIPKDDNNNDTFRFWDLAKWLMKNNEEFVNYYQDFPTRNVTMSNRIEARKNRIKSKLNDVIYLDLIRIGGTTKASTTDANIDLYRYTENGCLIAWLIQSMYPEKRENADNEIHKILCSHFENEGSSDSLFYVIAFNIMKDRGLFGNFANLLRQVLYDGKPIWSISELLSAVRPPKHLIENGAKNPAAIIGDIHEIIRGMDPAKRKLFFYHMKTSIEERMQKSLCMPAEYEKLRFEIRDKPLLVAIEGICKECKCPVHIAIEILGYLETKFVPQARLTQDCPHCKKEKSVIIPLFSNFSTSD